jgi:hypothetical protein
MHAKNPNVIVLEQHLVVALIHDCGSSWVTGAGRQARLSDRFPESGSVIAGVLRHICAARGAPADVTAAERDRLRVRALLPGHDTVVEVHKDAIRRVTVRRSRRHVGLKGRHEDASLRCVELVGNRDRGRTGLRPEAGGQ